MNIEVKVREIFLNPVEEVFEAVFNPQKLAGYFTSVPGNFLEKGKTVTWDFQDVGAQVSLQITELKKNEKIIFEWNASGIPTTVRMDFQLNGSKSTVVTVSEEKWKDDEGGILHAKQQTQGWTDFLCCLKAYLIAGIRLRQGRTMALYQ